MIKLWEKDIPLWDETIDQEEPNIVPYLLENTNAPCVIVCPGGGYGGQADHEGRPIAEWLNSTPSLIYPLYPDLELDLGEVKIRALYGRHKVLRF